MAKPAETSFPLLFELCAGGTAYEGKPQVKTSVKLDLASESLKSCSSYEILACTPYMLIIRSPSGAEISITDHGKFLIKHVTTEAEAQEAAFDLMRIVREAFRSQAR